MMQLIPHSIFHKNYLMKLLTAITKNVEEIITMGEIKKTERLHVVEWGKVMGTEWATGKVEDEEEEFNSQVKNNIKTCSYKAVILALCIHI